MKSKVTDHAFNMSPISFDANNGSFVHVAYCIKPGSHMLPTAATTIVGDCS